MFRGGLILALASVLGLFANFIFSIFLEKDVYGEVVTLFSLVSILVLIIPLGTNAFFLLHRDLYEKYSNAIIFFPISLSLTIGLFFLFDEFSLMKLMFVSLLVVSTLSIQGIMASQIKQLGVQAAIYQSLQPFLKSVAALTVLASVFVSGNKEGAGVALAFGLVISSALVIPFALWRLINFRSGGSLLSLSFFIKLTKKQWGSLLSFWSSSVLGGCYGLGIIPLVSYFHGFYYTAYLGIYFIFWSGGNILITTIINNHYWPRYCAERSAGLDDKNIIFDSFLYSFILALIILLGMSMFAIYFSGFIWGDYVGINEFLVIVSFSLSLRVLSAWVGMMLLSNELYIYRKVRVQIVVTFIMCIGVIFLDLGTIKSLAWLIFSLEILFFGGYLLSSIDIIRNKKLFEVRRVK